MTMTTTDPTEAAQEMRGQLTDPATALQYIMAGNAIITIQNPESGRRFTYRIKKGKGNAPHFVNVMNGPDNESAYEFLGTVFEDLRYRPGRRSKIHPNAPSARTFEWLISTLTRHPNRLRRVELWHEGRCGRCNRLLTVPESIAAGIGPECAKKAGV